MLRRCTMTSEPTWCCKLYAYMNSNIETEREKEKKMSYFLSIISMLFTVRNELYQISISFGKTSNIHTNFMNRKLNDSIDADVHHLASADFELNTYWCLKVHDDGKKNQTHPHNRHAMTTTSVAVTFGITWRCFFLLFFFSSLANINAHMTRKHNVIMLINVNI